MKRVILFFIILLITVGLFAQNSEKRVALIIGNSGYRFGGALTYPNQDAQTMKNALQELNFDVIFLSDATQLQMRDAFLQFMRKVDISNISLIYYSGHGIQIDGVNYLVPIDANISDKYSAKAMSINVNDWVSQLEVNEKNLNIVILDACRNNPFKAFTKGTENGLKPIPAPSGTIIAFATVADNVAQDNGLYAKTLASEMRKIQRIEDVFMNTRNIIETATNGQQSPMEWVRIKKPFYFKQEIIYNNNNSSEIVWQDNKFGYFTDSRDNHKYKVVKIGNQIWFAENLAYKYGRYWEYPNTISNAAVYGLQYNWETAVKVCPIGWHLPSNDDWTILVNYLGGENEAGGKLKSTSYWASPNPNATNSSGFSALPGGYTGIDGVFTFITGISYFWSSTQIGASDAGSLYMDNNRSSCKINSNSKSSGGESVRCIKD